MTLNQSFFQVDYHVVRGLKNPNAKRLRGSKAGAAEIVCATLAAGKRVSRRRAGWRRGFGGMEFLQRIRGLARARG